MVPSRLKPIKYFKTLIGVKTRQAKQWTKMTTISDKAQEASYAVAEILAKKIKSHTIAQSIIL
jgi:hypothetical protein